MCEPRTETETLASAMDKLAQDIQTEDGVANAAIHEAAMRLRELQAEVVRLTIDRDNWKDRAAELHESLADNRSLRARVTEVEVKAERYRLVTLRQDADLARVTAEREAEFRRSDSELAAAAQKESALRARVAEVVRELSHVADCSQNRDAENMLLQQRNTELVAALDDLLGCPTVTDRATCPDGDPSRIDEAPEWQAVLQISCAWTRYKKLKVLASAESATPAKLCKQGGAD